MSPSLATLLAELERAGAENDARPGIDRADKMLNISRDVGELLTVLVGATKPRRILELGTSNGYSTLWLAEAARLVGGGARVTTVEQAEKKVALARSTFSRAGGLGELIQQETGDAGEYLRDLPAACIGFLFLDAGRAHYVDWWPELRRILAPGGLMIVDNAVSHADELAAFMKTVREDSAGFLTALVPAGKGEWLVFKPTAADFAIELTATPSTP
jgi:predicted O-methyltransferase YrrM